MPSSNVRNIDSLEMLHGQLIQLSSDWGNALQEVRVVVQRAESYFRHDRSAHWRRQLQLAEREWTEAKDNLARLQSATRAEDRAPATEATKRVRLAGQRARTCQAKVQLAKSVAIEIGQACDAVLGPLADIAQHCEVVLPTAARQLRILIEQLRNYAEQNPTPPHP